MVTGGTDEIGLAIAQEVLERGGRSVVIGRRRDQLERALAELGRDASGVRADVASSAEMNVAFTYIAEHYGHIDALFVNTDSGSSDAAGDITEVDCDRTFSVNILGLTNTVQRALPLMRPGSSVTVTGTVAATKPLPGLSFHASSKAAMRNLLRSWVLETRGSGIRMNMISPSAVDTEALRAVIAQAAGSDTVDSRMKALAAASPLGHIATPRDIALVAVFLASDEARAIHGADIILDGGSSLI